MTPQESVKQLLQQLHDTGDLVLPPDSQTWVLDELNYIWEGARADAELAYEDWCRIRGAEAYWVYRATQDRADAAQDTLALWADRHPTDRSWLWSP